MPLLSDAPRSAPAAPDPTLDAPVVLDTRVVTGSGGGPDKTILNSPRFLNTMGYRMICGYLHPPHDPGYADIVHKAERYQAPLVSIADRGAWDWRVVRELLKLCRREKVQIWHGHDYKTNALGLLLKRFWPMRLVTTVHGWVHHTSRTPLYYKVDRFCLPRYEKVLCVSEDLYNECRSLGVPESACVLLENGIDTQDYQRRQSIREAKQSLGFPPEELLLGAVGRLEPEKAFDMLIHALATLREEGVKPRLVIVGEGNDRARLEALIQDRSLTDQVTLAGWQSDVRRYFEAMDLFALCSLREGLPNVLLEAMALEVPCVASRIAGIPRLITHQQDGWLIEAGQQADLLTALRTLLTRPDERHRLGQAGRNTIVTRYSFAQRMTKLKTLYDDLLRSPARG